MKILLPWLVVLVLAAGMAATYVTGQKKEAELTKVHSDAQTAESTLRTELEETKSRIKLQADELAALRQDKEDLLRLRNQVRQLQQENQQLTKQTETARTDAERTQAQLSQATQARAQQLQQLQSENQQLRTSAAQSQQISQRNACINNLRQLDGAKQQWALENSKTASAVPTPQDLMPYLNNTLPSCPAGGQYALNAVGQEPTCSIPGHALPKAPAP